MVKERDRADVWEILIKIEVSSEKVKVPFVEPLLLAWFQSLQCRLGGCDVCKWAVVALNWDHGLVTWIYIKDMSEHFPPFCSSLALARAKQLKEMFEMLEHHIKSPSL